jgi:thioredoxin 1
MPVVEVTAETFDAEVLESSLPVLVDFWAAWSGTDRFTAPMLDVFSEKYGAKVKVVRINLDDNSQLAGQYSVVTATTLLVFAGGLLVKTIEGSRPLEVLESDLADYL